MMVLKSVLALDRSITSIILIFPERAERAVHTIFEISVKNFGYGFFDACYPCLYATIVSLATGLGWRLHPKF